MQSKWDSFDPAVAGGFAGWLPGFYGEVEAAADAESRWLQGVLPSQAAEFATGLLTALFSRIDKPFRMRLGTALSQGVLKIKLADIRECVTPAFVSAQDTQWVPKDGCHSTH